MAEFAYSLDGGVGVIKDFNFAAAYASTAKKGDFVVTDASGNIVKVAAAGATITGVLEGSEFTGLVPGTANASKTAAVTGAANGVGKVRINREAVYRIPAGNITAANIGSTVGVTAAHAGDTAAAAKPLRVIAVDGSTAFVTII